MRILSLVMFFMWLGSGTTSIPNMAWGSAFHPSSTEISMLDVGIETGEIIITLVDGVDITSIDFPDGVSLIGYVEEMDPLLVYKLSVPVGQESEICEALTQEAGVLYAEPNYIVELSLTPNDPRWPEDPTSPLIGSEQYGPINIHAPKGWNMTTGSEDIVIAIVDTGIYLDHDEFAGRIVQGYDFIEDDSIPQDEHSHGTHVAGIAAATGNNEIGIAGIDWKAKIMPVRVLNAKGSGTVEDTAEGIMWATKHGADVINLSLGIKTYSALLEDATYYAYQHGVVVVAAAGNDGVEGLRYPARFPWVVSVMATNQANERWIWSNYGSQLDLAAPGYSILSSMPDNEYELKNGTSMASPHVAGTVALMLSINPDITPDQVFSCLKQTTKDLGESGYDAYYGYGLIQVDRALECVPVPEVEEEKKVSVVTQRITQSVDAGGGVVNLYPFRLILPEGWISEPVEITLVYTQDNSGQLINGMTSAGEYLDIFTDRTVTDLSDNKLPVLVYAYQAKDLVVAGGYASNLILASLGESSGAWSWLPTTAGAGQLVSPLNHFSSFGVFAVTPQALPVTGEPDRRTHIIIAFSVFVFGICILFTRYVNRLRK